MSITALPWRQCVITACLVVTLFVPAARAEIFSYAIVRDNATLKISGHIVRLYGIYIPSSSQLCGFEGCARHAARALDFKIQGFVRCHEKRKHRNGSITAVCYYDGQDLGAYLIEQGWALAAATVPEYRVLEKIARRQSRGMWGGTFNYYRYRY